MNFKSNFLGVKIFYRKKHVNILNPLPSNFIFHAEITLEYEKFLDILFIQKRLLVHVH